MDDLNIPAVEHALQILDLVISNPEGLSPQDLLVQVDTPRSSLFLMLRTLKNLGYIDQSERRGRYRAGARLSAWRNARAVGPQHLISAFYQETKSISFPETIVLILPAPDGVMVVAQIEASQPVRCVYTSGQVYMDLNCAEQVLSSLPPVNISARGYSAGISGDVFSLVVPVCEDGVTPVAALQLSAPAFRLSPDRIPSGLLSDLRALAARISYRLGAALYTPYQAQRNHPSQPTAVLSIAELSAFLKGPWTARLACVRPDGKPHVIPVWQEWDGKGFWVIAWEGSQWARYVEQNPHVSLTIDEPWTPMRRVTARGTCSPMLGTDLEKAVPLERLLNRMVKRYLGQPASSELVQRVEKAFYIHCETLKGWQGLPG